MNLLEVIIILFTVGLAILGFRTGFVKKIASMLSLVLSIALVSAILPYMTDFLRDYTPVYDYMVKQCRQMVLEQMADTLYPDTDSTMSSAELLPYLEGIQLTRVQQTKLIEELPLPELIRDQMLELNNDEGYQSFEVTGFIDYVIQFIATMILNVFAFLAATIVVQILLRVLILALDILSHIPVIGVLNRLAGLVLGLVQALFFIWIFYLILSMLTATETGLWLMSMVQESEILSALYNSNLFMQIVLRAVALF